MNLYSRMPRIGTLMIFSRSFPMIDSSAMMSAMFSRIDSRTLSRCLARSPAERSLRSASEGSKGRKIDSTVRFTAGRRRRSVLPEIVGGVLEDHVDAALAVAGIEQVLHHRIVLGVLLLVPSARLGDDPADVAHGRHELLLDRLFERLVGPVGHALAAAARGPEVRDHLLAEALRRGADDRDLLLDRLEEPLVRLQLLLRAAVLHPRLVDECL